MTAGQKTAFSLLISVLVFAGCAVAAFTGGFKLVEARFYQPRVVASINKQLSDISGSMDEYFDATVTRFATYAAEKSVQTFVEPTPADSDVQTRTMLTGNLFAETTGLVGIRLIDSNGRYLHYSTYSKDVLKKTDRLISYSNYDTLGDIPYSDIASVDTDLKADTAEKLASNCTIYMDSTKERIIFSFPYYDKFSVFRGSLVFYMDSSDFTRFLVSRNAITLSDCGTLVAPAFANKTIDEETASDTTDKTVADQTAADGATVSDATAADESVFAKKMPSVENSGIVFGLPAVGTDILKKAIVEKWSAGLYGTEHIATTDAGDWILLTSIKSKYGKIGWVYTESIFAFPQSVKILLLVCIFITLFLIVFMLFNLKHDDMVVIRDRIRRFQLALVTEYVDRKDTADWQKISEDISLRKQDVSNEIKKSLGRTGKRHAKEVDALLNRSWDEIISTLGGKQTPALGTSSFTNDENTAQIKAMLEDILSKGTLTVHTIEAPAATSTVSTKKASAAKQVASAKKPAAVAAVSSLEEIPEAEPVEEVQEAEPVEEIPEAEPVEEVQEAEPVEEIPEAEAVEEVPEAEPVEEIPEAEPVEEIPEAEPVEEVQEAEPVEEIPEAEPVEEVPAAEPVEEVQEAEPVEEIPEAEAVEEVPAAEPVEEVQEAEPVEEIPEAEPVEEVPAAEPVEEVQEAEPVEEIPEAEPVEKVPEAEPVEEVPAAEPVEEIPEAEPVEEVQEAESVESAAAPTEPVEKTPEPKPAIAYEPVPAKEFNAEENIPNILDETQFIEPMQIGDPRGHAKLQMPTELAFSVSLPDFSFLDDESLPEEGLVNSEQAPASAEHEPTAAEQATAPVEPETAPVEPADISVEQKDVPAEQATAPELEPVDIASFDVDSTITNFEKSSVKDKEFEEQLDFDKAAQPAAKAEIPFVSTAMPDYSNLDESSTSKKAHRHGLLAAARNEEKKLLTSVPEVEQLAPAESSTFTFTKFGSRFDNAKPEELSSEKTSIVEENGVYFISNDVETAGVVQDPSFKKLVESVLK